MLLVTLAALNGRYDPPADTITVLFVIAAIVWVITVVLGLISTGVRRLHDRGKGGWWLMLYYFAPDRLLNEPSFWHGVALIIPLAAGAVLIWGLIDLGVLRGEPGDNVYGPNPLSKS